MKTLSFGLEIEIVAISKASAAQAVQSVVGGTIEHGTNGACQVIAADGRTWNVVHDGSLSGPSSQNAEVVTPILKYGDIEMFQEVIRSLRKHAAKLDSSCGLHYAQAVVMRSLSRMPIDDSATDLTDCA